MDPREIVDTIREQNWKNGGALVVDDSEALNIVQSAIDDERDRCLRIVHAARMGEIDGDFRCIASRIRSGEPYPETE